MAAAKPTLTYFPGAGRGFAIRAALRHAKVDFNDVRVPFKAFATDIKPDPVKCPLGSLPVLELPQGVFVQSTAIARWAAKKSDLYPTDEIEQLTVDMIMQSMNEMSGKAGQDKDPAVKKALREAFMETTLPKYMHLVEAAVARSGGPFILGRKFSIADLCVFTQLHMVYTGDFDFVPADLITTKYPVIDKMYREIAKHEVVRMELAVKPQ